jgi:hypothetical protein
MFLLGGKASGEHPDLCDKDKKGAIALKTSS